MTGAAAVACHGLTKRFGDGARSVVAVDGLDLSIPAGAVFGLLGPNGAGKTTTLRLMIGLARPTAGTVTIDGVTADPDDVGRRRAIGVLDQDPRFYGWMTGRELVELAARLQGLAADDARRRSTATLERVGLADAAGRRIGGYSGGMRQRLGIAQALVSEPSLLVLDEPVSSLDPEGRRDLLDLIADLRGTATVVMSTHVLADVERVCDRVAILAQGRLVSDGPIADLLERDAAPVYHLEPEPGQADAIDRLVARLGSIAWVDGCTRAGDRLTVAVNDPGPASGELLPLVVEAGVRLATFERARPTLEEVFLRLTGSPDA